MVPEQQFIIDLASSVLRDEVFKWKDEYNSLNWPRVLFFISESSLSVAAINKCNLDPRFHQISDSEMLALQAYSSIYKSENILHIWEQLKKECDEEGIYIIPLKGIVVRDYYPDPSFREMGDLDILYEGSISSVKKVMKQLGNNKFVAGMKHDHYMFENGVHIEMHRELVDAITDYNSYYKNIWDKSISSEGSKFIRKLTIDDQYIFVFIHMKEHLAHQEFMFKMAMDIFLLNKSGVLNRTYIEEELRKIDLYTFEQNFLTVVNAWFNNEVVPEELRDLSELLINFQQISIQQHVEQDAYASGGNKYVYFKQRFFPALEQMESYYGWLKKAPVLLPVAWGMRIVSAALFRRQNVHKTFYRAKQFNPEILEQADAYRSLLERYGIKK